MVRGKTPLHGTTPAPWSLRASGWRRSFCQVPDTNDPTEIQAIAVQEMMKG